MSDGHGGTHDGAHGGTLAHHFDSYEQQREAANLGMWLFLVTEIMFFGGMFLVYAVYRDRFHDAFVAGSNHLDIGLGVFNTAVLIGSSLTMALAVRAAQMSWNRGIALFLILTMLLGGVFLGVKTIEYGHKLEENLLPTASFFWPGPNADQVRIFFSLYFGMTGFHALHMVIGIAIMAFMLRPALAGRWNADDHNFVEGFGLYWHFVDIVWIFLFPLLYLLGQNLGH